MGIGYSVLENDQMGKWGNGEMTADQTYHTIIIGAGQAGLSAAYYLEQAGVNYIVLDKGSEVGEIWSNRWDSLTLFTRSEYNCLPGLDFPPTESYYPGKDHVAAYLRSYVNHHELNVQLDTTVSRVTKVDDLFVINSNQEEIQCHNLIIATGECNTPFKPACAAELSSKVFQIHSQDYQNPSQIKSDDVLVVGTANSGVQIARELAAIGKKVSLSGRENMSLPGKVMGKDLFWWFEKMNILDYSLDDAIGKRIVTKGRKMGGQLIGLELKQVVKEGEIQRFGKVESADQDIVHFTDGKSLSPSSIIWATGYRQSFDWLDLPITMRHGQVNQYHGVSLDVDGLYFVGMKLLHRIGSSLIGSGWKDSQFVVNKILEKKI